MRRILCQWEHPGECEQLTGPVRKRFAIQGRRRKGIPNKVTTDIRQAIAGILEFHAGDIQRWIAQVANGIKLPNNYKPKPQRAGVKRPESVYAGYLVKPDPAKATELMLSMAEFSVPKLARTEVTGVGGGPMILKLVEEVTEASV